jgi:hypothetical protein
MKRKRTLIYSGLAFMLLFCLAIPGCYLDGPITPTTSPDNTGHLRELPAPLDFRVYTTVVASRVDVPEIPISIETNVAMKIIYIERGDTAYKNINPDPEVLPQGYEYVLITIGVSYWVSKPPPAARFSEFVFDPTAFTAYPNQGEAYIRPDVIPPKPTLDKLHLGQSGVGHIVLMVPTTDMTTLMSYNGEGGPLWFALYN